MAPSRRKPARRKKNAKKGLHPALAMAIRILVVIFIYSVSRLIFWLFNFHYFQELGGRDLLRIFFHGIAFDLSAVLAINIPFIFLYILPFRFRYNRAFKRVADILFYAVNVFGLMASFVDLIYFRFTLKRLTRDIFSYLGSGGDFSMLMPQFIKDFWPVLICWILLSALLVWACMKARIKEDQPRGRDSSSSLIIGVLVFLVAAAVTFLGIRGGFQKEAIGLRTPSRYVSAKYYPLITNTPFTLVHSFGEKAIVEKRFYASEKELAGIYTPYHPGNTDTLCPLNVVILVMESLSKEHIGAMNRDLANGSYGGYTPFLDSLIGESRVYTAFANGKTSIQGIPTILTGIPALLDQPIVQSPYVHNRVAGLAALLKPYGYRTAFFHGGDNGIMDFSVFLPKLGFDRYYGRTEYADDKDYDGSWGIYDEEFLGFTAKMIHEMKPPFLAVFFSLSSHHPYGLPGKYRHQFEKGSLPVQQVVRYADYSLAGFFHSVRHEEWFFNTLFVITADHTSEGYFPYYTSHVGQYAVPLIFYKPGGGLRGIRAEIAQQTDIVPSVLGFLGYPEPFIAFGNDLFNDNADHFSVNYLTGTYTLIRDGYSLEFDGERTTSLFNLKKDPLQLHNLAGKEPNKQEPLEAFLKAYLQQYNNRMIENRLIVD